MAFTGDTSAQFITAPGNEDVLRARLLIMVRAVTGPHPVGLLCRQSVYTPCSTTLDLTVSIPQTLAYTCVSAVCSVPLCLASLCCWDCQTRLSGLACCPGGAGWHMPSPSQSAIPCNCPGWALTCQQSDLCRARRFFLGER